MTEYKKIIPHFILREGKAVLAGDIVCEDVIGLCRAYSDNGADEILIWEDSADEQAHEKAVILLKRAACAADIPIAAGGHISGMDDVKKYLYAGARTVVFSDSGSMDLLKEAAERFGKEKMALCTRDISDGFGYAALGVSRVFYMGDCEEKEDIDNIKAFPLPLILDWQDPLIDIPTVAGMLMSVPLEEAASLMEEKLMWKTMGIPVNVYEPAFTWDDLKKNSDGMVPVIVQDYITEEVLMLAYMNEEAYERTVRSGKMTYFSRSRKELWEKGATSGHYQYVKELRLDCDNDTILARVSQIGAACHTGNRSCFYQEILKKDYEEKNPLKIFDRIYDTIQDRKVHPREGSYTNYLFGKGIDKILKKVGEEATEIVIASKNPEAEEAVYEIADFLYHLMVLMVEKEISWDDIVNELANR